jgi:hypothetical protein
MARIHKDGPCFSLGRLANATAMALCRPAPQKGSSDAFLKRFTHHIHLRKGSSF